MIIGIDGKSLGDVQKVGLGYYGEGLITSLCKKDTYNQYLIYIPSNINNTIISGNFSYIYVKCNDIAWNQYWLQKAITNRTHDLFIFPSHIKPILYSRKNILVIYDLAYMGYKASFTLYDYLRLKILTKLSVMTSSHVVAISNNTKNDLVKFLKIDDKKISVIYPGYKPANELIEKEDIEKIRNKYGVTGEYIIYIGTLQKRKNIETLIKALIYLNKELKLVIVGKLGWLYNDIFKQIDYFKLNNRIIFTGYVSERDKRCLLKGAKVFVLPSLYEGFGLPILEAFESGTPIVISNNSSLVEVGGDAALYIDPFDERDVAKKISHLLEDANLRERKIKLGYERIKLFDWENTANQFINLYQNI